MIQKKLILILVILFDNYPLINPRKNNDISLYSGLFEKSPTLTKMSNIHNSLSTLGMGCDHFLGRTHAPRTSRFRSARTRVRTSNLEWLHFAPGPAPFVS